MGIIHPYFILLLNNTSIYIVRQYGFFLYEQLLKIFNFSSDNYTLSVSKIPTFRIILVRILPLYFPPFYRNSPSKRKNTSSKNSDILVFRVFLFPKKFPLSCKVADERGCLSKKIARFTKKRA